MAIQSTKSVSNSKTTPSILTLAQSDRERELIHYSVYKASGLSATSARKTFGFERMTERSHQVEQAICEARQVCEEIDLLARVKEKAILLSLGVEVYDSDASESESDDDSAESFSSYSNAQSFLPPEDVSNKSLSSEFGLELDSGEVNLYLPTFCELQRVLTMGQHNWFCVVEYMEEKVGLEHSVKTHLSNFYDYVLPLCNVQETVLLKQSLKAYTSVSETDLEDQRI